jgi:undecaprenyl diphosphate synthase
VKSLHKETATLNKNNIRLNAIGDLQSLQDKTYKELKRAIENTRENSRTTLTLALSYSSRWELRQAVRSIAAKVKEGKAEAR